MPVEVTCFKPFGVPFMVYLREPHCARQANEDGEWDGVVDREYIKHRTAKLLAVKRSADAKAAAAKAAL